MTVPFPTMMRAFVMTRSCAKMRRSAVKPASTASPAISNCLFMGGILRQRTAQDVEDAEEKLSTTEDTEGTRSGGASNLLYFLSVLCVLCCREVFSMSSVRLWWSFCGSVLDSPRTESLHGGTDESSTASMAARDRRRPGGDSRHPRTVGFGIEPRIRQRAGAGRRRRQDPGRHHGDGTLPSVEPRVPAGRPPARGRTQRQAAHHRQGRRPLTRSHLDVADAARARCRRVARPGRPSEVRREQARLHVVSKERPEGKHAGCLAWSARGRQAHRAG